MRILELHAPYFRALWRREHDVLAWGPHAHCDLHPAAPATPLRDILRQAPAGWTPDAILLGDDSQCLQVLGLEDAPCPVALLSVDAHHHAPWHAPLASACDAVFVAQRDYLPAYAAAGAAHARWLPLWAADGLPEPAATKTHAVAFVGTLDARFNPERVALIEALRSRLPLHVARGRYDEVFTRSRIVLNQTVKGDLNFRVFEAMACGALLLTERTGNGLLELFADGTHLVTYPRGDVDAVVAAAHHHLDAEGVRARIAECGRACVRARHLESHRAGEVLATVTTMRATRPAALRSAGVARAYCVLAYYEGRLAEVCPTEPVHARLSALHLAAAALLAHGASMAEPDRRAVLGLVALERNDLRAASGHLAWAAHHGGRAEDYLAGIEALVRAGELTQARAMAAALRAAHPDYTVADRLAASLERVAAPAEAPA